MKAIGTGRRRNRVGVSDELFAKMKAVAKEQGVSMADVLEKAVRSHLE